MNKKALVLLSSGLDSVIATAIALEKGYDVELALFFNYGQKAYEREKEYVKKLSDFWSLEYHQIDLPWYKKLCGEKGLIGDGGEIPDIENVSDANENTAQSVWIPNRNGVFVNIAAAVAEAKDYKYIITGFNVEEAATFPDNSKVFIEKAKDFFLFSTMNHVEILSPTIDLNKKEIVKIGKELNAPFHLIYSCYRDGEKMCGKCESCQRLKAAYKANNMENTIKERFV